MRQIFYRTLLLFVGIYASHQLAAEHIIGGVITYECLGFTDGDPASGSRTYRFTMKIYRDCATGIPFDGVGSQGAATVSIFPSPNGRQPFENFFLSSPEVTQFDPNPGNPCLSVPSDLCVEEGVYTLEVDLDVIDSSYFITYQRCCRSESVANLVDSRDIGATYTLELTPEAQRSCNSSAQFSTVPPLILCADEDFSYRFEATDPDGDRLVYAFCEPFNSPPPPDDRPNPDNPPPYDPLNFQQPDFSFDRPLGPTADLTIDPGAGVLAGRPLIQGQFVVGICVQEFRGDTLMGEVRWDFHFNVTNCVSEVVADINADSELPDGTFVIDRCGSTDIRIENQSVREENIFDLRWEFDLGNGNILTDTAFQPNLQFPGPGTYPGRLLLNPGTQCADTAEVQVVTRPNVTADFTPAGDACRLEPYQFFDASVAEADDITNWAWTFGDGGQSTEQNPAYLFANPGVQDVQLVVTTAQNCSDTAQLPVPFFPVPEPGMIAPSATEICVPETVTFTGAPTELPNGYTVFWDFGDGGTAQDPVPSHTYTQSGIYTVAYRIEAPQDCALDIELPTPITASLSPEAAFTATEPVEEGAGLRVEFTDNSSDAIRWFWQFGTVGTSTEQNPAFVFPQPQQELVTLVVENQSGCTDTAQQLLDVFLDIDFEFPNAFTPNDDGLNDIFLGTGSLAGITAYELIIFNRYGEQIFVSDDPAQGWNGREDNAGDVLPPGVYTYIARFMALGGEEEQRRGIITLIR